MRIHIFGTAVLNGSLAHQLNLKVVVSINTRTSIKGTSLPTDGGPLGTSLVDILAGTAIGMFLLPFPTFQSLRILPESVMGLDSVHHRTDIYGPDASVYNPHRWDNNWKPDTWTYMPFNRGMRSCLGKSLALMEVKFVLCRVLQAFSSIELLEKIGDSTVSVPADKARSMQTKIAF
jgi:hypothetical protein